METIENPMDGFVKNETERKNESQNLFAFDAKNYLNVRLGEKEDKKEIRIRTIPISADSNKHFTKIYMHNLKVNKQISSSGFKSYVCLSKTSDIDHDQLGDKCPICEIYETARKESYRLYQEIQTLGIDNPEAEPLKLKKKEWDDIKNANTPSEVGIIRCIERGKEEEGPKFWKINLHFDKTDALNQIYNLFLTRRIESIEEQYNVDYSKLSDDKKAELHQKMQEDGFKPYNLLDLNEGKDLKITIEAVYDKSGKKTNKTTINVIEYGNPKPITTDSEKLNSWINDSKKWNDVFVAKPYEYLSIIADGKYPFFDKTQNKWVEKEFNKSDDSQTEARNEVTTQIKEAAVAAKKMNDASSNADSELPF